MSYYCLMVKNEGVIKTKLNKNHRVNIRGVAMEKKILTERELNYLLYKI